MLSFDIFWGACQPLSPLDVDFLLFFNFFSNLVIGLFHVFDGQIELVHVLVDECVLVLLFEEGFGDFLEVLDSALLFDLLEVLVDEVHVFSVLLDDLYFLFVVGDDVL